MSRAVGWLLIAVLYVVACRSRVPDVGGFTPVLEADARIVELLREADSLAQRDPDAAVRNLRDIVLPRARQNWERVGTISVLHPRAQSLREELVRITAERVDTVEHYADALANRDPSALHENIQRQVALDRSMIRLEADVASAKKAEPDRGCAVAPGASVTATVASHCVVRDAQARCAYDLEQ